MKTRPEWGPSPKSTWRVELRDWVSGALSNHRVGWALAVVAVSLCLPSAWSGRFLDDQYHRAVITGESGIPGLPGTPARLFDFVGGDPETNQLAMERGQLPWWSAEDLRIGFFRPLAALTHWADYALWPDLPGLMHLQSLLWLSLAVIVASVLYRRVLLPPATAFPALTAGLAAAVFALDDAHSLPAGWLANRYALLCLFFGFLTLIQHDRWRRDGGRPAAWLAAAFFASALLCGELSISTSAYLLAYAVFLDRGRWSVRVGSLAPYLLVGVVWTVIYKTGGYGARGSAAYIDPVADPFRFAAVAFERAPVLLAAQWWFPPSDLYTYLSPSAARTAWWVALFLVAVIALAVGLALWRAPVARFFALGMVLSVLPASAMYPSDRLLAFVGFGGAGLVALLLATVLTGAKRSFGWRGLALALGLVHFVLSPFVLYLYSANLWRAADAEERIIASLPTGVSLPGQYVLFVDAPDPMKIYMPVIAQALRGDPAPGRPFVLGAGIYPLRVERTDEHTVILRPAAGFLAPRGTVPPGYEGLHGSIDADYFSQAINRMFRSDEDPFVLGQRIDLDGVQVEITEMTPDSRAAAASFRFDEPLEDPSYRWLRWDEDHFVPFTPPPVGGAVTLRGGFDSGGVDEASSTPR